MAGLLCSSSVGKHICNEITQHRWIIQVFGSNWLWCSKHPVLPHLVDFSPSQHPKYVSVLRVPILSNDCTGCRGCLKQRAVYCHHGGFFELKTYPWFMGFLLHRIS